MHRIHKFCTALIADDKPAETDTGLISMQCDESCRYWFKVRTSFCASHADAADLTLELSDSTTIIITIYHDLYVAIVIVSQ